MPVAEKKGPKKPKKGGDKALPPPPPVSITVKDCMVWPEPVAKKPGKGPKKGGTGPTSKLNAYRSTETRQEKIADQLDDEEGHSKTNVPPPQRTRRDDGTVIEALRGWPGSNEQAEDDAYNVQVTNDASSAAKALDPKPGMNSKKKGKKGALKKEAENVYIGDLIHQRYLNDYLEKRRKEMEREQRKKDESAYLARAGRRAALERSNIKANRTSQLRSIALAEKVEPNPLDLWKMPRFTRGAKPHLATTDRSGARRSDQYEATDGFVGDEGCDGGGDGCYCDHHTTNYVDGREDEIQYGEGHCCKSDSPMAII